MAQSNSDGASTPLGYQPSLDGLRGVAVLAVLTYHSGLIRGGFLGVDMFFTLSGFLITRLLLQERAATGAINLRSFYVRRALRLLPALVVFLLLWTCFLLVTIPPEYWSIVGSYVAAVLFYVANWAGIHGLPMGIFGHTWSLAIEEQFYLAWPLVVAVLVGRLRRPRLIACLLALVAVVSLAWRLHLALGGATERRIYWATDAHADGLLIGAALAFLLASRHRLMRAGPVASGMALVALVGLLGLLVAVPFNPSYAYGVSALVALATSALILEVGRPGSRVARLLEARWLVWAGRISYALYLWHFPIFSQFGVLNLPGHLPSPRPGLLAWSVTFAAALASYFFVERPALVYKDRFSWREREAAVEPLDVVTPGALAVHAAKAQGLRP